jgi:hypothetical protein
MTWMQKLLAELGLLGANIQPILTGLLTVIAGFVATKVVPWLTQLAAKEEANVTSASATTSQKVLSILELLVEKAVGSIAQNNVPNIIKQIESGTITDKAQLVAYLNSMVPAIRTEVQQAFDEVAPDIGDVSQYGNSILTFIRNELNDITPDLIAKLPEKTPAPVVQK